MSFSASPTWFTKAVVSASSSEKASAKSTAGMLRAMASSIPVGVQFPEQAHHLNVNPDEGHQDAEGGVPFHVLWRTISASRFNKAEVADERERSNDQNEQRDADADKARGVQERHGISRGP